MRGGRVGRERCIGGSGEEKGGRHRHCHFCCPQRTFHPLCLLSTCRPLTFALPLLSWPLPPCLCRLGLGVAPLLEKNLEFLNDCLDDLMVEQGKLSMYQNNMRRQQQAIAQFKMQRRQENMAKRAAGE